MICIGRGDASSQDSRGSKRGQGNFKLAANFGYSSRGSADPRESLRKHRILKLALSAHKVDVLSYALFPQVATDFFKYREAQQTKVDATVADSKNGAYPV